MPIGSIQYRAVTEKYQKQAYLSAKKNTKITKCEDSSKSYELTKIISLLETKNSSVNLKDRKFQQTTSRNQNTIKTSLVLLLLLNIAHTEVNANDTADATFNSLIAESNVTLQTIVDSYANTSVDYSIANAISIYESRSSKEEMDTFKDTRENYLVNKVIKRENKKISSFLKKQGILGKNKKLTKEELIFLTSIYCFKDNFHNSRQIARRILSASRPYKSEKHETLSNSQIETIIRNWIFENILNTSPAEYIAKIIARDKNPFHYTINDIIRLLSVQELEKHGILDFNTLSLEMRSDFNAVWQDCLRKEMPFLCLYDEDESVGEILLDDIEFSNLYTGGRYLSELDSLSHFNRSEALEIGKKMWEQAIVEGISIAMEPYFFIPSLFFEAQNNPEKISKIENVYDISEIVITEELKYREITEQIYKRIADKLDAYKAAIRQWHKIKENSQSTNEEINKVTEKVTDRFFELDEYLIFSALNSIENYEIDFIFSSEAIIHPITLSLRRKTTVITPFHGTGCFAKNALRVPCFTTSSIISLDKTDLFSVSIKDKERIYALKNEGNKYNLFRVDRNISKYIKKDILENKEIKSEYLLAHNEIKIENKKFYFDFDINRSFVKEKGESITKFIDFLRNVHRDSLYTSLCQINNHPSTLENLWSFFKHFVPLYNCVDALVNKDLVQSILPCSLDSIIIAPLIGDSIYISEKFSLKLVKRMRTSGISLTNSFAFLDMGKAIREKIYLPTINQLSILGEHTLKILHPGFRLLGSISPKYTNELINFLSNDKETVAIAQKLDSLILRKPQSHFPQSYITARLPESEIRVPIRKVGEKDGQDLYAILNPDTGETAWARFIIKENNQLVSLDTIPEISISKALEERIVPDMYINDLDIQKVSAPDYLSLIHI